MHPSFAAFGFPRLECIELIASRPYSLWQPFITSIMMPLPSPSLPSSSLSWILDDDTHQHHCTNINIVSRSHVRWCILDHDWFTHITCGHLQSVHISISPWRIPFDYLPATVGTDYALLRDNFRRCCHMIMYMPYYLLDDHYEVISTLPNKTFPIGAAKDEEQRCNHNQPAASAQPSLTQQIRLIPTHRHNDMKLRIR